MGRWGRKEEEEVVKGTEEGVPGAPEVSTAGSVVSTDRWDEEDESIPCVWSLRT